MSKLADKQHGLSVLVLVTDGSGEISHSLSPGSTALWTLIGNSKSESDNMAEYRLKAPTFGDDPHLTDRALQQADPSRVQPKLT